MTETEILKQQIAALETLIKIKDQTISALQSRPYYHQPYWYGNHSIGQTYAVQNGLNQYQQQANQCNQGIQTTVGLCSVNGGAS